jgi:hypothetical protein
VDRFVKEMAARIAPRFIAKVRNCEFILEEWSHQKYRRLTASVRRDASAADDDDIFACGKQVFEWCKAIILITMTFGLFNGVLWQFRSPFGLAIDSG